VPLGRELPLPGHPRLADLDVSDRIRTHLIGIGFQDREIRFLLGPPPNPIRSKARYGRSLEPICVVPATSFFEYADTKPRKTPKWFALGEDRPVWHSPVGGHLGAACEGHGARRWMHSMSCSAS
jgi:hypothetical protein